MSVSEHANYLLNEYGRLQFDYAAYCKPYGESLRNEARNNLEDYIAELEAENNRLAELLHNELSSVEIATDLGNKRWVALNDIYENGEKHNTNWCKRIAQKGLGIK